jgi:hypothetical protein
MGVTRKASVGFVATKPVQIITSLNVIRQLGRPNALLSVTPTFHAALSVIARLARGSDGYADVLQARSRVSAILALVSRGVERVFLDSDVGLRTPFAMWMSRTLGSSVRFSLYEEGTSLVEPLPEQRPNRFYRTLGATSALGEGALTEEVWTYAAEAVKKRLPARTVRSIDMSLTDFVRSERDLLIDVFWPSFAADSSQWSGARCCVYLSSWNVEPSAFAYLARTKAFTVCKFHPHIGATAVPTGVDQVIDAAVPAELLILELARVFDSVEVLHQGSATAGYVQIANVRFAHMDTAEALQHTQA